jgi:hypothetical protein
VLRPFDRFERAAVKLTQCFFVIDDFHNSVFRLLFAALFLNVS